MYSSIHVYRLSFYLQPIVLEYPFPREGMWYFVELDRNSRDGEPNKLYINGNLVDSELTADLL